MLGPISVLFRCYEETRGEGAKRLRGYEEKRGSPEFLGSVECNSPGGIEHCTCVCYFLKKSQLKGEVHTLVY